MQVNTRANVQEKICQYYPTSIGSHTKLAAAIVLRKTMALLFSVWILLVTIACIYLAWRWSRRAMEKSIDLIPGPRPWPIIGNVLDIGTNSVGIRRPIAFLDLLLRENDKGASFTDVHLREEVDTFITAGHDTTASCLSFALYLLSKHPDVQEKVYREVKTHISETEAPTTMTLSQLKYLECVIKETLRLYPSVPIIARKIHEDIKITDNRILSANITIIIPIYMVHRHPKHFWDPETFNPDRFLPERTVGQHPYSFIPFSSGSRNCIGQKFAMLEMKLAIAQILMHYKLLPDKDYQPILSAEIMLKSVNGIKLRITSREL